jgi:hypothetical protein
MTAAITVLFAVALAAAVAGRGFGSEEDGPTQALRSFLEAADGGDRDKLLGMLGPKTRARLENAAARATELVGGEGRYSAREMLQPLRGGPEALSGKIINLGRDGNTATLSIGDRKGGKTVVSAVLVEGRWLIELPAS